MLKKLLLALVVALPFTAFAQKFGVVNSDEVLAAMPATKTAETELNKVVENYRTQMTALEERLNKLNAEYQALEKDPSSTETMKELKRSDIQEAYQKYEQFNQVAQQDIQKQQAEHFGPIQQEFLAALQSVGAENGFTFIFPNEPSLLLYTGTDVVDVTPLVKAKLKL